MKILAWMSRNSSPAYHRIMMPLGLMDANIHVTNVINEEVFENEQPTVFMYNRVLPDNTVAEINKLRDKMGFKIVVDIDDFWELDPHHILKAYYDDEDFAKRQVTQLLNADAVFVTHNRLAEQVKLIGKEQVHVLPNAIPRFGQFCLVPVEKSREVRLFWQGSATHYEDLNLLRHVFSNLVGVDNIKMIMAGYDDAEMIWHKMAWLFTAEAKLKHELIGALHFSCYYQIYRKADICLVPLINSRFNSFKSNLKVLEAANLGLPVIAHNVHPYKDMPVLYANGTTDWVKQIRRLASSSKRRDDYGHKLREFCDEHYSFKKINLERKQILENL